MTRRHIRLLAILLVAAATTGGLWLYAYGQRAPQGTGAPIGADVWTCPMHPEIQEHAPGRCPKCGMELEKKGGASPAASAAPPEETPRAPVQLDARRRQLLGVRTARAEEQVITRQIRAVGVVRYDETRLADVNLKLDGWVRKLHVDYTGQPVRRGQPLLELYSPDLLATQNEYLLALSTRDAMQQSEVADARSQSERLVESARQRLLLWDLPADELQKLERTRKSDATVTFRSPVNGFVIEKPIVEGMRVMPGQTLYKVADLSTVWVETDVFESDAPFVRLGAPALVTVAAWPGVSMRGRAVYIYPFVEEKTRTLKVRFEFPNPRQQLKPGMYANVDFAATLGSGVTIPADALLDAGREHIVFVAEGDGHFEPRRVTVGHRFADRVQIVKGIGAGEQVATGAAFFLDSESQLRAAAGGWARDDEGASAPGRPAQQIAVAFRTLAAPRAGENEFEAVVSDAQGRPITDAEVSVVLYMPPMPSMNMPAMRSEARLRNAGEGRYRAKGMVSMSGRWDVTVTVTRNGARLGVVQATLVAQ